MARHKSHRAPALDNPTLDISSLIDVCFLLLIYFIVTSTISPREQDLTIGPPSDRSEVTQIQLQPLYIEVAANGSISTGMEDARQVLDTDPNSRDLPMLQAELRLFKSGVMAAGDRPLVQIDAAPDASHQRVIDVLNALAAEGIEAVTLTDRDDG